jgi:hypothetical protein
MIDHERINDKPRREISMATQRLQRVRGAVTWDRQIGSAPAKRGSRLERERLLVLDTVAPREGIAEHEHVELVGTSLAAIGNARTALVRVHVKLQAGPVVGVEHRPFGRAVETRNVADFRVEGEQRIAEYAKRGTSSR